MKKHVIDLLNDSSMCFSFFDQLDFGLQLQFDFSVKTTDKVLQNFKLFVCSH